MGYARGGSSPPLGTILIFYSNFSTLNCQILRLLSFYSREFNPSVQQVGCFRSMTELLRVRGFVIRDDQNLRVHSVDSHSSHDSRIGSRLPTRVVHDGVCPQGGNSDAKSRNQPLSETPLAETHNVGFREGASDEVGFQAASN